LPNDVAAPSSPSLLLPANLLIFTAKLDEAVSLGRGMRSYSIGAERLSTPLLSCQAIAEPGRSLLSAHAKMLLVQAIRPVAKGFANEPGNRASL
jgi:hypothetical protein